MIESILLMTVLILISMWFYMTRKFKWIKCFNTNEQHNYKVQYRDYVAYISTFASENSLINVYVYRGSRTAPMYEEIGCKSVGDAKEIAEKKILEDIERRGEA